jgi:hypothetical protein
MAEALVIHWNYFLRVSLAVHAGSQFQWVPEMSSVECLPGRAGGSPQGLDIEGPGEVDDVEPLVVLGPHVREAAQVVPDGVLAGFDGPRRHGVREGIRGVQIDERERQGKGIAPLLDGPSMAPVDVGDDTPTAASSRSGQ